MDALAQASRPCADNFGREGGNFREGQISRAKYIWAGAGIGHTGGLFRRFGQGVTQGGQEILRLHKYGSKMRKIVVARPFNGALV